jgi:hypothetical protein
MIVILKRKSGVVEQHVPGLWVLESDFGNNSSADLLIKFQEDVYDGNGKLPRSQYNGLLTTFEIQNPAMV